MIGIILVLVVVVAVAIFGNSPTVRGTPIHKLHTLIHRINATAVSYVGESRVLTQITNWSVPIFYAIAVLVTAGIFFNAVFPEMNLGFAHKTYIFFTLSLVAVSFVLTTYSDPGQLTQNNAREYVKRFPYNGLIFFPRDCYSCHLPKPARSKHCSSCKKCVVLFDHHCIWVNNCIGLRNYRWFVMYLWLNMNLLAYGGYLNWSYLVNQNSSLGWWKHIQSSSSNRAAGALMMIAFPLFLVTAAFAALHMYYVYLGVTTNESDKWAEIEHLVSLGVLFRIPSTSTYVELASEHQVDGSFKSVYIDLDQSNTLFSEFDAPQMQKINLVESDLHNVYDRGFWNNLQERLQG